MVRITVTCVLIDAGIPGIGVMVRAEHVTTTKFPSTLMTPPYVETPHSGEVYLVMTTLEMDHCGRQAGDVPAPCKHVPSFGIFSGTEVRAQALNISPGPGAKTARTRSLD